MTEQAYPLRVSLPNGRVQHAAKTGTSDYVHTLCRRSGMPTGDGTGLPYCARCRDTPNPIGQQTTDTGADQAASRLARLLGASCGHAPLYLVATATGLGCMVCGPAPDGTSTADDLRLVLADRQQAQDALARLTAERARIDSIRQLADALKRAVGFQVEANSDRANSDNVSWMHVDYMLSQLLAAIGQQPPQDAPTPHADATAGPVVGRPLTTLPRWAHFLTPAGRQQVEQFIAEEFAEDAAANAGPDLRPTPPATTESFTERLCAENERLRTGFQQAWAERNEARSELARVTAECDQARAEVRALAAEQVTILTEAAQTAADSKPPRTEWANRQWRPGCAEEISVSSEEMARKRMRFPLNVALLRRTVTYGPWTEVATEDIRTDDNEEGN